MKTKAIDSQRSAYFLNVYKQGGDLLDWNFGTAGHKLIELVISGVIKKGHKILDIGSGPGNESVFLAKYSGPVSQDNFGAIKKLIF